MSNVESYDGDQMSDAIDRIRVISDLMQTLPIGCQLADRTIPAAAFSIFNDISTIEKLVAMLENELRTAQGLPPLEET